MDRTRRNLFTRYSLRKVVKLVSDVQEAFRQGTSEAEYFDSYATSYPLISEYSYFIDEEVEALGIDTSSKSAAEIAEVVYAKRNRSE